MSIVLHHADCFAVFPDIADQSVDMILCDPPYGTTANKWDSALPLSTMWENLNRVIKNNGAIVLFGQNPFSSSLLVSNYSGYKHTWHWNKKSSANFAVAKYMPLTVTEDILVFSKKGEKVNYYPQMMTGKLHSRGSKNAKSNGQGFGGIKQVYYQSDQYYPTNLLEFSVVPRKHSKHPSQKPVELLEYLIRTYSLEGETVLDFTMGSGSTGIACKNLNRHFIGIEKELEYYEIAKHRILTEVTAKKENDLIENMYEE